MTTKGAIKIQDIVEAAISEFLEKGYEQASMEGIAKAAHLSKGGLYHHFNSKAEILMAANVEIMKPLHDIFMRVGNNSSLVDGLNRFVEEYLGYWNQHRREITLYFYTMNITLANEEFMQYYKEIANGGFDCFEAYFAKGQELGIFREGNAREHAVAFISCLDGYLGYMLMLPELNLDKMIAEIQHTFIADFMVNK